MDRTQDIADRVAKSVAAIDTASLVKQISRLTDQNNHTEAALMLADALGNRKFVKVMEAIQVIIAFTGDLPRDLSDIRHKMLQHMWKEAKRKWGEEVGQQIYMSF